MLASAYISVPGVANDSPAFRLHTSDNTSFPGAMGLRPHIVYLVVPSPSSRSKTRIISGRRRTEADCDQLQLDIFSGILLKLQTDETFKTLHKRLPFVWLETEPYDTVNPFGDFRGIDFKALWNFDIQNDTLTYINRDRRAQISLDVLRSRPVTLDDMKTLGPPVPPSIHPRLDPAIPHWKPHVQVDGRNRAFLHRILRDFDHQWRHLFRNNYNTMTLRVLARAIIQLCTLDFEVREETGRRHGLRGEWVYITELPTWKPFETDVVPVGDVNVVLCQSIQEGISAAKEHKSSHTSASVERAKDRTGERPQYMILSVKHIVLCRATGRNELDCTAPEPLFNGNHDVGPPSDLALDYLLWATAPAVSLIHTPLSSLPIEIQDMILGYSAIGPIAAAKTGCLLSLGTPFLWKDGLEDINLEEHRRNRQPWSPVESQLWFQDSQVGITYRGRA